MPGALYCFRGPDRVRKLERIRQLADQLHIDPLDQHLLNAAQVSTSEFLGLIREHPMNSPLRLVVIDEAHRLEEACLKALAEQGAREASQTACVVLLVESDVTKKPAWQALCARASIEEFSEAAAKTPDHFALLNAIARRDVPSALQGLREQLAGGKDEIELLGLIVWQLQRWLTLAHLMTAATPRAQMETAMGWNSWQVERMTGELKGRSVAWLQEALEDCWQLDRDAKSGRRPLLTTALEQMVVSLCLPAPREQSAAGSASPIACSNAR
ncbi:MAG: hypothetical protein HY595_01695 [Candidatus Omnitrophica bacterium]|nr:hypothetical protein [Candidatus Omnitrophota bacterium]